MDEAQSHHLMLQQSEQSSTEIEVEVEVKTDAKENVMKCQNASPSSSSPFIAELPLDETRTEDFKNSTSQFFHFVRLMQLFPSVHPATLHTVMTLCKCDFFVAVDRLLYAKRCKELYETRRRVYHCTTKDNINRCSPYSCATDTCGQNSFCVRPTGMKMEATSRRSSRRSRGEKHLSSSQLQMQLQQQHLQGSPITLQCNVPLRPLSPTTHDSLNSTSNNVETVEGIEVVVTQI